MDVNSIMRKLDLYLVDDEPEVSNNIRVKLQRSKRFRIKTFISPLEARNKIAFNPPHILIADYLMPELDGITLLRETKAQNPKIWTVLLTGQTLDDEIITALDQNIIDTYIAKPYNLEEMATMLLDIARDIAKRDSVAFSP